LSLKKRYLGEQRHVAEPGRAAPIDHDRVQWVFAFANSRPPDPGEAHADGEILGQAIGQDRRSTLDGFEVVHTFVAIHRGVGQRLIAQSPQAHDLEHDADGGLSFVQSTGGNGEIGPAPPVLPPPPG
jgi:hypothetical protein